jgi:hypothetical protein
VYDSTATTTITGLDHLEGESVAVWADGGPHPAKTVASGQITLDHSAGTVHVGLPYTSTIEPMKFVISQPEIGSTVGRRQRIYEITISFYKTSEASYGIDTDNLKEIVFSTDVGGDSAPTLFTGEKTLSFDGAWDKDSGVVIQEDGPGPMTIRWLAAKIKVAQR